MATDEEVISYNVLNDPLIKYIQFMNILKSYILDLMKKYSGNILRVNGTLKYCTFGFRINEIINEYGPFIVSTNVVDDDIILISFSELFGPYEQYADKAAFYTINRGIIYNNWQLIYSPTLIKNEDGTFDTKYSKQFKDNINILAKKLSHDQIMNFLANIYSKGHSKFKLFYTCTRLFENIN